MSQDSIRDQNSSSDKDEDIAAHNADDSLFTTVRKAWTESRRVGLPGFPTLPLFVANLKLACLWKKVVRKDKANKKRRPAKLKNKDYMEANYFFEFEDRPWIYRFADICLMDLPFSPRDSAKECTADDCRAAAPPYPNQLIEDLGALPIDATPEQLKQHRDNKRQKERRDRLVALWQTTYNQCMDLVRHDDKLNWQKFNYILAVFGILVGAYRYVSQDASRAFPLVSICLIGIFVAWVADATFQEGLRCLRGHKRKVKVLERRAPERNVDFVFDGNPYNRRHALESTPAFMLCTFIFLAAYAIGFKDYPDPVGVSVEESIAMPSTTNQVVAESIEQTSVADSVSTEISVIVPEDSGWPIQLTLERPVNTPSSTEISK